MKDPDFFPPERTITAADIVALVGAELRTPQFEHREIGCIASLSDGGDEALVYAEGRRQADELSSLRAAAILCPTALADLVPDGIAVLLSDKPRSDFAAVGRLLFPRSIKPMAVTGETGISPAAHIADDARIEAGAIVEPGVVVAGGAAIGSGTVVGPNAVIGPFVQIGRNCQIGAGATIVAAVIGDRVAIHTGARIGQDGFGYVPGQKGLEKQPQVGRVIIQDDVELGANTTVDRGAVDDTVIGQGTKIDNLVQIAHNVRIGRHCAIAAHCGISGSVTIGDYAMLGGRVGLADHISIGDGAQLAASSGVMHDVPAGAKWMGTPAKPIKAHFREIATIRSLAQSRKSKGKADG